MTRDALRAHLHAGLGARFGVDRPDWKRLHVSDLKDCPRAVWARIRGLATTPLAPEQIVKFQQGHAMEYALVQALYESLHGEGWALATDVLCWFALVDGVLCAGRLAKDAYAIGALVPVETALPHQVREQITAGRVLVGHADALLSLGGTSALDPKARSKLLLEVKSEVFLREASEDGVWRAHPPAEPRESYAVQGEFYPFALAADAYAYLIGDRASGGSEIYGPHPALAADAVTAKYGDLIGGLLALVDDVPMPAPAPPKFYGVDVVQRDDKSLSVRYRACASCRFAGCERNTNPMTSRAQSAQEVA